MKVFKWMWDFSVLIRHIKIRCGHQKERRELEEIWNQAVGLGGYLDDKTLRERFKEIIVDCKRYGIVMSRKSLRDLEKEILKAKGNWHADA